MSVYWSAGEDKKTYVGTGTTLACLHPGRSLSPAVAQNSIGVCLYDIYIFEPETVLDISIFVRCFT